MERDFLGAIGRTEKEVDGELARVEPPDYMRGPPAMQWPFPAKAAAVAPPAFMSFRSEDSKEAVFGHFSLSGFRPPPPAGDAYGGVRNQASTMMPHQQRQFVFDGQVGTQQHAAAVYGHHVQGMDSYGVPAAHHHHPGGSRMVHAASMHRSAVPYNAANPMLRVQSLPLVAGGGPFKNQSFAGGNNAVAAGSAVGMYSGARDLRDPKAAQMTIFYNGLVNVFDNVPVEKARELTLLASRASIPSPPCAGQKSDSPISGTAKAMVPEVLPARQIVAQKPESCVPHVSGVSSPVGNTSQVVTLPKSTSSSNNDAAGTKPESPKSDVPLVTQASSSQPMAVATSTAAAIMPRAVPQARKASLARFLEKRKERVSSVIPYPSSKSPLQSNDTVGSASAPSKSSSCTDIAPSSNNGEESFCLEQPRNICFSTVEPLSTKLHI